ncbi:Demethylsterigmatocystin 6-O-methyltransferase [Penicillium brevicompactum]
MTITTSLQSLVNRLGQIALKDAANPSPQVHYELLQMIEQLRAAVESPTETVLRLIYQNSALRIVIDLGIFSLLVESWPGDTGLSATQLAEYTGGERDLIVRLMRVMVSLGLCGMSGPEIYIANEKTVAFTQPIGRDGLACIYDLTLPALSKLPEYMRSHGYSSPKDYTQSPMQWAVGQSQFEWLSSHPEQQQMFNSYMTSRREGKPMWFDVYPVERLLGHGVPFEDTTLLVDVGGNRGHDLVKFRQKYDHLPGRLILQDLPDVVKGVSGCATPIEVMAYSFLDPQPIQGARAYYFRAIFHDWPDHICQTILRNTISAMARDYSKILIVDFVLPDTETPLMQSSMDIQMMSIGAGMERSKQQWINLLKSVGLEVTGIWSQSPGMESVIEAVPMSN